MKEKPIVTNAPIINLYIKPDKSTFVKKGNIKNLAFSLGEVWKSRTNDIITHAYLQFYIDTFSVFSKQKLDSKSVFSNNLYKYSISRT